MTTSSTTRGPTAGSPESGSRTRNPAAPTRPRGRARHAHRLPGGRFRLELATDRWWWSEGLYHLFGFERGDVLPTTSLVLAHTAAERRGDWTGTFASWRAGDDPVLTSALLRDASGRSFDAVVAGAADDDPLAPTVDGYIVDDSEHVQAAAREVADEQIAASARSRATIEQAKGILMALLGGNADSAFERLSTISQHHDVRLRAIAALLVDETSRSTPQRTRSLVLELVGQP